MIGAVINRRDSIIRVTSIMREEINMLLSRKARTIVLMTSLSSLAVALGMTISCTATDDSFLRADGAPEELQANPNGATDIALECKPGENPDPITRHFGGSPKAKFTVSPKWCFPSSKTGKLRVLFIIDTS